MPIEAELKQLVRDLGIELVEISDDVNYWLVRTHSGMYYDAFKARNFVGVAWPWEEELFEKTCVKPSDERYLDTLRDNDRKNAAQKIKHFISHVRIGDIVLSPASRSSRVLLGRVMGDVEFYDNEFPYVRRRSVDWISEVTWEKIPQVMSRFLLTHHGICSAENIATEIDRLMYPMYIKNDEAYLTLQVRREKEISASSVSRLLSSALSITQASNWDQVTDWNKYPISFKSEIRSPGFFQFFGDAKKVFLIVLVCHVAVGGETSLKIKDIHLSDKTQGLIPLLLEKGKELRPSLQELNVDGAPFIRTIPQENPTSSDLKNPGMEKQNDHKTQEKGE